MDPKDAAGVRHDLVTLGRSIAQLAEAVEMVGNAVVELAQGRPQNGQNMAAGGAHTARVVRNNVPTR